MSKLNNIPVVSDDLIAVTFGALEQLRQGEPLAGHLVAVVCVDELVIVDTVRRIALHSLHRRFHLVQSDDIVDQRLPRWRHRQRLARVRGVVAGRMCLADFKMFTR